jgi:UDP-N-acetylmuramate--alanine ligase
MPLRRTYQVHFVGIGGIGMSGIAEVLLNVGYRVSGSDLAASETTLRLENLGARVSVGHAADQVGAADAVVVSSAVTADNPEVVEARRRGVPVIQRAEMLAELMRMKVAICVAGSHGKTTTTSILGSVLAEGGLDPTMIIGGRLNSLGSNARLGQSEYLVAEADESDGSFLKLTPTYGVITNIDPEHLDHYGSVERLHAAFIEFANKVPFYGLVAVCIDHPVVQDMLPHIGKRLVTYGLDPAADYRALDLDFGPDCVRFDAYRGERLLGPVELKMIGEHNALNALACIAVADELQVPFPRVQAALERFEGIQRRFTQRGRAAGVTVVDDYGHHPVEIRATLAGARKAFSNRLVVVFQPHRYSRTRDLEREFHAAFDRADVLLVMDIYPAGEQPIEGVHARMLYRGIRNHGPRQTHYIADREHVVDWLLDNVRPNDWVVTMGAGDVWRVGEELLERLRRREDAAAGGERGEP